MAERSVTAKLSANVMGFVNGVRVAERAAVDFGKNAVNYGQKYGAQLDDLSMKAGILGTGMVALAGFAVKSAMDWESAWAGVTKTVDGTPEQLAAIEDGLRSMSEQLPVSAIELAAIAESAGALGVETDSILSFTRVMADLGETTNLSSEEAATSIAQLMNVMQTAPEDVDNLGSALVDLGNKGASTERQIIQMAQNIAGAGEIVGLSEANVLALGNALASSGIEAEAGGSAISNVLIDIDKSVSTGGPKLEKFAQVAGMTADAFATKWQSAPADAIADFVEGLGRMNQSGENVFATLSELGQSDIRVTRALLNMAASGDMLRESLANGDTAWEQNTALAEEAAKRYDTTAAQAKMSWNQVKGAAVDAGNALLPVVSQIADVVGTMASAFSALPDGMQGGIATIVGVGGVGLIAAAGIMKIVTAVGETRLAFQNMEASGGRTVSAIGKVAKAAGVATVAITGLQLASKFRDDSESVSSYTKAIIDLGDKGPKALEGLAGIKANDFTRDVFGEGIDGIAATLQQVDKMQRGAKGFGRNLENTLGIDAPKEVSDIQAIDQALTALATSGATQQAATAFDYLSAQAEKAGVETENLKALFPGYTDALTDAEVQQKLTGDSATGMADAMGAAAGPTEEAMKALKEARDAANETGNAFFDIAEGVNDADVSLDAWIQKLADQAQALDDFADNARKASKRGLSDGLIADLQELGPEGAMRLEQLADASEGEIDRANAAYRKGKRAIADYTDEIGGVPDEIITTVSTPGLGAASSKLGGLLGQLNAISGNWSAVINVSKAGADLGSLLGQLREARSGAKKAAGGPIFGPGSGTSDDVPIMASNGEHMLTAQEVTAAGGHAGVMALRRSLLAGPSVKREYAASSTVQLSAGGESGPLSLDESTIARLERAQERSVRRGMAGARFVDADGRTLQLMLDGG